MASVPGRNPRAVKTSSEPSTSPFSPVVLLVGALALTVIGSIVWALRPAAPPAQADAPQTGPSASAPVSGVPESPMKSLLAEIADHTDANPHAYWNHAIAERLAGQLGAETDIFKRMHYTLELAEELLSANRLDQAIRRFEEFMALAKERDAKYWNDDRARLRTRLAIAHLRRSEQANCIAHHNPESCLFPISGDGVHGDPDGARKAIDLLHLVLDEQPENLQARWLLTVASLALGEEPSPQTAQRVIPVSAFDSAHDIGRFTDIAGRIGLGVQGMAGGSALDDFDRDGDFDLFASSWGQRDQIRYFTNNGKGQFEEMTESANLNGILGGLNMAQADYDNDGDLDLFVTRGAWLEHNGRHPNSLIRNDGDNRFTDVTEAAGMLSFHPTSSAAWLDFDNDGLLDLFVANETVSPNDPHPCELFRNQGDGTFREVSAEVGLKVVGYIKGVATGDFDNDGRTDLFLSDYKGANRLFRNPGGWTRTSADNSPRFQNVAAKAGVTAPINSFPCWFFDYDNDGFLDLFVADYDPGNREDIIRAYLKSPLRGEGVRLYRNRGDGTFADVTQPAGLQVATLAMGVNFGDLDNDGFLDFYLGTGTPDFGDIYPNRMFRNDAGKRFQDVTTSGGFGHLQKGHGIAFGDIDADGDQDVYAVMGGAYTGDEFFNALFQNPGHGANWIKVRLTGKQANRSALGARIKVVVNENGATREIHRMVGSGGSFGCNPLQQEIGLGKATAIERIEIRWPGGSPPQVVKNPSLNATHHIEQSP